VNRVLLMLLAVLASALVLAVWRIDHMTGDQARLADALDVSQQGVTKLQEAIRMTEQAMIDRDRLDESATKELKDARDENKRLAADVAAGSRRLHVSASCPAVPADPGSARVDDARAELNEDARRLYFNHREQVILDENKLRGLQAYVRQVCRPAATE